MQNIKLQVHVDPHDVQKNRIEILNFHKQFQRDIFLLPKAMVDSGVQELKEGTILKMGKEKLRVKKIQLNSLKLRNSFQQEFSKNGKKETQIVIDSDTSQEEPKGKVCRVCLEEEEIDRPFEKNLCLCSETMPIHIECLIRWIKNKTNTSQKEYIYIYDFTELSCDICKTKYPQEIEHEGKKIPLFTFEDHLDSLTNYVVFEVFDIDSDKIKHHIAVNMENYLERELSVGRRDNNDIVLRDISVSRLHCKFLISNGRVFLRDCHSKFGTLISAGRQMKIIDLKDSYVMLGNLKITLHLFRSRFCCKNSLLKNCLMNPLKQNPLYSNKKQQKENKVSNTNQIYQKKQKLIPIDQYYDQLVNKVIVSVKEISDDQNDNLEILDIVSDRLRELDLNLQLSQINYKINNSIYFFFNFSNMALEILLDLFID